MGSPLWNVMQAWGVGMGLELIWLGLVNLLLSGYLAERPLLSPPLILFAVTAWLAHREIPRSFGTVVP